MHERSRRVPAAYISCNVRMVNHIAMHNVMHIYTRSMWNQCEISVKPIRDQRGTNLRPISDHCKINARPIWEECETNVRSIEDQWETTLRRSPQPHHRTSLSAAGWSYRYILDDQRGAKAPPHLHSITFVIQITQLEKPLSCFSWGDHSDHSAKFTQIT